MNLFKCLFVKHNTTFKKWRDTGQAKDKNS